MQIILFDDDSNTGHIVFRVGIQYQSLSIKLHNQSIYHSWTPCILFYSKMALTTTCRLMMSAMRKWLLKSASRICSKVFKTLKVFFLRHSYSQKNKKQKNNHTFDFAILCWQNNSFWYTFINKWIWLYIAQSVPDTISPRRRHPFNYHPAILPTATN